MTSKSYRTLEATAWAAPVVWAVPWARFRGENAHGGYVWWGQVHLVGLVVFVLAALSLRTYLWRTRDGVGVISSRAHLVSQVALVGVVVILNWLSFQTGMARHHPPASLSEFLWSDP